MPSRMHTLLKLRLPFAMLAMLVFVLSGSSTLGQSGSRSKEQQDPRANSGSTNRAPSTGSSRRENRIGLEGYCPVCIVEMKKWVRGVPEHQVEYDGKFYFFPGPEQKEKFLSNPAKYAPALGGDCVVCLAKMNKRMPGNIRHGVLHAGRLFLFPKEELKQEFLASPETYENVDLALGGKCSVCRVELGKEVAGKPEFSAIHQGMRYLFPGEQQRQMFLANPTKYALEPL